MPSAIIATTRDAGRRVRTAQRPQRGRRRREHHQHQRDQPDRALAREGLREHVVGAAVHVEQRRVAAGVVGAAAAEVLLLVAHRERLAAAAQDRQERAEPQARRHVRLPIGHLRDRPGPRGEAVHRARTAGDPDHDEAGADREDHGRGSRPPRGGAASEHGAGRSRPGSRQPDDGRDDAGGDDRPGDPAAALVAEDDGDERDGQESGGRGEPDETAPARLATGCVRRAGLGSAPGGQSHSARIAGVAKQRYSANQPAWPNVDCSRSAPLRLVNGSVARSTRRSR